MPSPAYDPNHIYEIDRRTAELCTRMQWTGFAFDVDRAREMTAFLRDKESSARAKAETAVNRRLKPTKTGGFGEQDLEDAFFRDCRAPVIYRSALTDAPSLGVDALMVYAAGANERLRDLSLAILEFRRARKVRSTYIAKIPVNPSTGRVHPSWQNYGAVTGRWSCSSPNIMNLPRAANDPTHVKAGGPFEGGIRSLYIPAPGHEIVAFDAKQLEMRMAAYVSGDEAMIAATLARDLHAANAEAIFGERFTRADKGAASTLRDIAKSSGFAVCYLATADTVYNRIVATGVNVRMREVEAMLTKLKRAFRVYYTFQDDAFFRTLESGYVYTPIDARRRWVGHDPQPPEVANFPIQGGAADLMNRRLPRIEERMRLEITGSNLLAQVHDAGVFEVPRGHRDHAERIMTEIFTEPLTISSSGRDIEAVFPIDIKCSDRWS